MSSALVFLLVLGSRAPAAAEDTRPPFIVHEPCDEYREGRAFEVRARFIDESGVFQPKLIFRSGNSYWDSVAFVQESDDTYKAVVPAGELKGKLEYFIDVFDMNGNGPAQYGGADVPVTLLPAKEPRKCRQVPELCAAPTDAACGAEKGAASAASPPGQGSSPAAGKVPSATPAASTPTRGATAAAPPVSTPVRGAPSAARQVSASPAPFDARAEGSPPRLLRTAALVSGGTALAASIFSAYFGLRAKQAYDKATDSTYAGGQLEIERGERAKAIANAGWVVAAGALAIGATSWAVDAYADRSVRVAAMPAGTGAALVLFGTY